jgi:hypothetical protein
MISLNRFYYVLKPLIPRPLQITLRKYVAFLKRRTYRHVWPIDYNAGKRPGNWPGWPYNRKFAFVLTHDVDTARGFKRCSDLINLEKNLGFRSSFNFVPERYGASTDLQRYLIANGFEVGVHGLNHDGKLFSSKRLFEKRCTKINDYLRSWDCAGFRSPAMHHNLDWISNLNIDYDASTFDTDPFEPQPDGVGTIFPFWVKVPSAMRGFVELPCTLPQDFVLFVLLNEKNIDIWKKKLDWISEKGGMALLNTHPDYMSFNEKKPGLEEFPVQYYLDFLNYVKLRYNDQYWHALPHEISSFIRNYQ